MHGSEGRHDGGEVVQISLMRLRNTDGAQSVSPVFSFTKEETRQRRAFVTGCHKVSKKLLF